MVDSSGRQRPVGNYPFRIERSMLEIKPAPIRVMVEMARVMMYMFSIPI